MVSASVLECSRVGSFVDLLTDENPNCPAPSSDIPEPWHWAGCPRTSGAGVIARASAPIKAGAHDASVAPC